MPMPRRLHFGGHQVDVLETLDQWYGPDYQYIKARGTDGGLYILRFDEAQAEWEQRCSRMREHKRTKIAHDGRAERTANCSA